MIKLILTTLLALGLFSTPAQAVSQCKGMPSAACGKAGNCTWVNSYKRKDGKKVNGYCRKKPGKSSVDKLKSKASATKAKAKAKKNEIKNKAKVKARDMKKKAASKL